MEEKLFLSGKNSKNLNNRFHDDFNSNPCIVAMKIYGYGETYAQNIYIYIYIYITWQC